MWKVTSDPARYDDALKWWRARVPLTKAEFTQLEAQAKARAFTLAGVAQLDLITEVMDALDRAVAEGTTLTDFKAVVQEVLTAAWGAKNPARIELVFRNAVQRSYGAGRYAQMTDPDVIAARPYWRFDAVLDSRTSAICRPLNGTLLPADSPFWESHYPPLHHACRSGVYSLTTAQAQRLGIDEVPEVAAAEGFGAAPGSGQEWQPNQDDYPPELWRTFKSKGGV